jgi:hypothetical protein
MMKKVFLLVLLLIGLFSALVFAAREIYPKADDPYLMLPNGKNAQKHKQARVALLAGDKATARKLWLEIAADYEAEGRLQEAAWTYAQAGERQQVHELLERIENMLKTGKIVRWSQLKGDYQSAPRKAVLDNGLTVLWKLSPDSIGEPIAYRFDKFVELNVVPVTVERTIRGHKKGSFQYWVPAPTIKQLYLHDEIVGPPSDVRFLVYNLKIVDKHNHNMLMREGDYFVAIDNWIGIRGVLQVNHKPFTLDMVPRPEVYERYKNASDEEFRRAMEPLPHGSFETLRYMRQETINSIEGLIKAHGAAEVFGGVDYRIPPSNLENCAVHLNTAGL